MAAANTAPQSAYRDSCHCGEFVYEVHLPDIKSVFECNCSICYKKGYLWLFPGDAKFSIIQGDDCTLTAYAFGPQKLTHRVSYAPSHAFNPPHKGTFS